MQNKVEHEPELKDMDDYHKPMPKNKLRVIVWSFLALGVVWLLFKVVAAFFLQE